MNNPLPNVIASLIVVIIGTYAFFGPREESPPMDMTNTADRYWTALCVYHEARGEPQEAQIGVAQVILNRMVSRSQDAAEVVFAPGQFSWANDGNRPPILEYHSFLACMLAVDIAIERRRGGDTFAGADHFFDDSIEPPSWADSMRLAGHVGAIYFYSPP